MDPENLRVILYDENPVTIEVDPPSVSGLQLICTTSEECHFVGNALRPTSQEELAGCIRSDAASTNGEGPLVYDLGIPFKHGRMVHLSKAIYRFAQAVKLSGVRRKVHLYVALAGMNSGKFQSPY